MDLPPLQTLIEGAHPIVGYRTDGANALALWQMLRAGVEQTGAWPVILGDRPSVDSHASYLRRQGAGGPRAVLAAAEQLDIDAWLHTTLEMRYAEDDEFSLDELLGEWPPDAPPNNSFMIPYTYQNSTFVPRPEVFVGLVPTTIGHEVPAFLDFGDWNACPGPEVHCAVQRRWQEHYGAEVVGISHDMVELRVAQPPRDRDEALALAREQFAYCSDLVETAPGMLTEHAASLLTSSVWFFWWD